MTKNQKRLARNAYMRAWRADNKAYFNAYFAEWRTERKVEDLEVAGVKFTFVPVKREIPAFTSAQA